MNKGNDVLIIKNVSEYLSEIKKIISGGGRFVYRGEQEKYDTYCLPNIFRNKHFNYPNFEKNIIEKLRASGLDDNSSYLLTAIEAQHGGFPSRLLDISYNALIALHFAVTPFYTEKPHSKDDKDGIVYVIKVENMHFPSSSQIEDFYLNELLDVQSFYNKLPIFSNHFKMLDFFSKNSRIKAQQGGFILFCGSDYRCLPEYLVKELKICKNSKQEIREELLNLFNISNAFVYPESNNIAQPFLNEIPNYSPAKEISLENEINEIYCRIRKQCKSYVENILDLILKKASNDEILKQIKLVEKMFFEHYLDLKNSVKIIESDSENSKEKESLEQNLRDLEKKIDSLFDETYEFLNRVLDNQNLSTIAQVKGEY